jgi:parallel beta-helix repeat protein
MYRFAVAAGLIALIILCMINIQFAKPQPAAIFSINSDGSVTGSDKITHEDEVYTFTSDMSGSVSNGACFMSILKDNIIIDGSGHTLRGTGTGIALQLQGVTNVTVKNLVVDNFGNGIDASFRLDHETDIITWPANLKIINNNLKTTYWGISLRGTNNSIVSENTFTSYNRNFGLDIGFSYNNTIADNVFFGGGLSMQELNQNTFSQNTLNDKALVVLENQSSITIESAGQVFLFNCENITVRNIKPVVEPRTTIQLSDTRNSLITDCIGTITLSNSSNNTIGGNQLPTNGLTIVNSHNNIVADNIISASGNGIDLGNSNSNIIYENTIQANGIGVQIVSSKTNIIAGNNITGKEWGIKLAGNSNNIHNNNISACRIGIQLSSDGNIITENIIIKSGEIGLVVFVASNNVIYHNNFILNMPQVEEHYWWEYGYASPTYSLNNTWDNREKGNFWSNYYGHDTNSDGIWDEPYQMTDNFTDYHPLIDPFNISTNIPFPTPAYPETSPTLTPTPSPSIPELPTWTTLIIATATILIAITSKRKKENFTRRKNRQFSRKSYFFFFY